MCAALRCAALCAACALLPVLCCAVPGQRASFCMPATLPHECQLWLHLLQGYMALPDHAMRAGPREVRAVAGSAGYLTGSRRLSGCACSKVSLSQLLLDLAALCCLLLSTRLVRTARQLTAAWLSRCTTAADDLPQPQGHARGHLHCGRHLPRSALLGCGSVPTIPCERRGACMLWSVLTMQPSSKGACRLATACKRLPALLGPPAYSRLSVCIRDE